MQSIPMMTPLQSPGRKYKAVHCSWSAGAGSEGNAFAVIGSGNSASWHSSSPVHMQTSKNKFNFTLLSLFCSSLDCELRTPG